MWNSLLINKVVMLNSEPIYSYDSSTNSLVVSGSGIIEENQTNIYKSSGVKTLIINDSITEIGINAFKSFQTIEKLSLPSTLKTISGNAFKKAFNQNHFSDLIIPDSVTYIGPSAFTYCAFNNIILPDNLQILQSGTFQATNFYSIKFPSKLIEIGDYCFGFCANNFKADLPDTLQKVGKYALYHIQTNLSNFPSSLKYIDDYGFAYCSSTSLLINEKYFQVEYLGQYAFSHININLLTINIEIIPDGLFYGSSISYLNLQEGVKIIGMQSFQMTTISSVILPDSCIELKQEAFYQSSLKSIKGNNIKIIGSSCFKDCKQLTEAFFPNVEYINDYAFYSFNGNFTGFSHVIYLGSYSFYNSHFSKVIFPKTLEVVGVSPFCYIDQMIICYEGTEDINSISLHSSNEFITVIKEYYPKRLFSGMPVKYVENCNSNTYIDLDGKEELDLESILTYVFLGLGCLLIIGIIIKCIYDKIRVRRLINATS